MIPLAFHDNNSPFAPFSQIHIWHSPPYCVPLEDDLFGLNFPGSLTLQVLVGVSQRRDLAGNQRVGGRRGAGSGSMALHT